MYVLCLPAAQEQQELAGGVQELAPNAPLYVPAAQLVQKTPMDPYFPAAQFEQEVSAFHPTLYVPAAPAQAISAMSPIRRGRQSGGFEEKRPIRQCNLSHSAIGISTQGRRAPEKQFEPHAACTFLARVAVAAEGGGRRPAYC